jgi:hypothetical protein
MKGKNDDKLAIEQIIASDDKIASSYNKACDLINDTNNKNKKINSGKSEEEKLIIYIRAINGFLNNEVVQMKIKEEFDNKNYPEFDPSFGDDGCQTRPINIITIINKKQCYIDLPAEDRLYLTLCHVLHNYKKDQHDQFDLLYNEVKSTGNIRYGQEKAPVMLPKPRDEVIDILSIKMADLSVHYLMEAAKKYNLHDIGLDVSLTSYIKPINENKKEGYSKRLTTSGMKVLYEKAKAENTPVLLKITRLEFDGDNKYKAQGADVIMYLRENGKFRVATEKELYTNRDNAAILIEAFSILNIKKTYHLNSYINVINSKVNFKDYVDTVKGIDLEDFSLTLAMSEDLGKNLKDKTISSEFLKYYSKEAQELINYDLSYARKSFACILEGRRIYANEKERNKDSVPLSLTHIIVSCYSNEIRKIINLSLSKVEANSVCQPKQEPEKENKQSSVERLMAEQINYNDMRGNVRVK